MGDLPNLPVTVTTDWWALGLQMLIALVSFGVTILAVVLGVRYSLKSFYTQKWWETKAEAYAQIIRDFKEHFFDLVGFGFTVNLIITHLELKETDPNVINCLKLELSGKYEKILSLSTDIIEIAYKHSFYLNGDAQKILHNCGNCILSNDGFYKHYDNGDYNNLLLVVEEQIEVIKEAIVDLERLLKMDLNIT